MGARLRRLAGFAAGAQHLKCLLDEHLSRQIAELLRQRGLDVQAVRERPGLVARSDDQVMRVAAEEGRAVVTNNVKDYRPIAAGRLARGDGHAGLVLLPAKRSRTKAAAALIAAAVAHIMRSSPAGLPDTERWIEPFD